MVSLYRIWDEQHIMLVFLPGLSTFWEKSGSKLILARILICSYTTIPTKNELLETIKHKGKMFLIFYFYHNKLKSKIEYIVAY